MRAASGTSAIVARIPIRQQEQPNTVAVAYIHEAEHAENPKHGLCRVAMGE